MGKSKHMFKIENEFQKSRRIAFEINRRNKIIGRPLYPEELKDVHKDIY